MAQKLFLFVLLASLCLGSGSDESKQQDEIEVTSDGGEATVDVSVIGLVYRNGPLGADPSSLHDPLLASAIASALGGWLDAACMLPLSCILRCCCMHGVAFKGRFG